MIYVVNRIGIPMHSSDPINFLSMGAELCKPRTHSYMAKIRFEHYTITILHSYQSTYLLTQIYPLILTLLTALLAVQPAPASDILLILAKIVDTSLSIEVSSCFRLSTVFSMSS